jgi:uncharacterized Zn finger protein (UPF0148 family)
MEYKKCPNCNFDVARGDTFCGRCGYFFGGIFSDAVESNVTSSTEKREDKKESLLGAIKQYFIKMFS